MKTIKFALATSTLGFLVLGWYATIDMAFIQHRIVPGQEWMTCSIMALYTVVYGSILFKFLKEG